MSSFNVTTYGAKGDGSTDDSAAFNSAIGALNSAGSGTLLIPAATGAAWVVDVLTPITVSNAIVSAVGAIVKKKASGTNAALLSFLGVSNCNVTGLTIDGNAGVQSWFNPNPYTSDYTQAINITNNQAVFADNIQFNGGSGNTVTSVTTINAGQSGIRFNGSPSYNVSGSVGRNNGFGSFVAYNLGSAQSNNGTFTSCTATLDFCDSFRVVGSNNATVSNIWTQGTKGPANYTYPGGNSPPQFFAGIYFDQQTGGTISGNTSFNQSQRGIDCDGTSTNILCINNTVYGNPNVGILGGGAGWNISGNTAYDNNTYGITVRAANTIVEYNTCRAVNGQQNYGILSYDTTTLISFNDLRGNTLGPIDPAVPYATASTGNVSIVKNATDKPYSTVFASLSGNTQGTQITAYVPRVGDKNATFIKTSNSGANLISNNGAAYQASAASQVAWAQTSSPAITELMTGQISIYAGPSSLNDYFYVGSWNNSSNYFNAAVNVTAGAAGSTASCTVVAAVNVAGTTTNHTGTAVITSGVLNTLSFSANTGTTFSVAVNGTAVSGLTAVSYAGLTIKGFPGLLGAYQSSTNPSFNGFNFSSAVADVPIADHYNSSAAGGLFTLSIPSGSIAPPGTTVTLIPSAQVALNGGSAGATATATFTAGLATVSVPYTGSGTIASSNNSGLVDPYPAKATVAAASGGGGKNIVFGLGLG